MVDFDQRVSKKISLGTSKQGAINPVDVERKRKLIDKRIRKKDKLHNLSPDADEYETRNWELRFLDRLHKPRLRKRTAVALVAFRITVHGIRLRDILDRSRFSPNGVDKVQPTGMGGT